MANINYTELLDLIKNDNSLKIIDVRDLGEFNTGHIPNAINLTVKDLATKIGEYVVNKDDTIVVYCLSGGRAKLAESFLVRSGFTNVKNFVSINSWEGDKEK